MSFSPTVKNMWLMRSESLSPLLKELPQQALKQDFFGDRWHGVNVLEEYSLEVQIVNKECQLEALEMEYGECLALHWQWPVLKGGVVLIDEIDTGLHYSVMQKMWKMISARSVDLGIQVFATTHSRDCYESLASIVESDLPQSEVAIHRIEPDRESGVTFSNQEVVVAANRGLEVR